MLTDGGDNFISNKSLEAFSGFIFGFHGQAVKYVFWDETVMPTSGHGSNFRKIFFYTFPTDDLISTIRNSGKPQPTGYCI